METDLDPYTIIHSCTQKWVWPALSTTGAHDGFVIPRMMSFLDLCASFNVRTLRTREDLGGSFGHLGAQSVHAWTTQEPTNHLDIESVEALTTAISNFNGGLVLVSHDARLITEVDCELWVCEDGGCYRFETWLENSLGRLVIRKGGLRPFQTQVPSDSGARMRSIIEGVVHRLTWRVPLFIIHRFNLVCGFLFFKEQ